MTNIINSGTIASQDANNVAITGGSINNTQIGDSTPSTAVFSNLSWPWNGGNIAISDTIEATGTLARIYTVSGVGITLTMDTIGTFISGAWVGFVNTDPSNSFTLASADLISGQSSIIVPPYGSIMIFKDYSGTTWTIFSDNSTQTGAYLEIANNLSDLANNLTAINNLQLPNGYLSATIITNITLVHSGGDDISTYNVQGRMYFNNGFAGTVNVTLPTANSTTAGAKSIAKGQSYWIQNTADGYDPATYSIILKDNAAATVAEIKPGTAVLITLIANASAAGTWRVDTYGNAYQYKVTDYNTASYDKVPVLALGDKTVGNIAIYATTNGSLEEATLTNGQLLIGSTGVAPVAAAIIGGIGITVTNGAGSITIDASGSGSDVVNVTTSTQAMLPNTKYIINYASGLCTLTLPATFSIGDEIEVMGNSAGGWSIIQNTGQNIRVGSLSTTTTSGSLSSANRYDCIKIEGLVADTTMTTTSSQAATFTIV